MVEYECDCGKNHSEPMVPLTVAKELADALELYSDDEGNKAFVALSRYKEAIGGE